MENCILVLLGGAGGGSLDVGACGGGVVLGYVGMSEAVWLLYGGASWCYRVCLGVCTWDASGRLMWVSGYYIGVSGMVCDCIWVLHGWVEVYEGLYQCYWGVSGTCMVVLGCLEGCGDVSGGACVGVKDVGRV